MLYPTFPSTNYLQQEIIHLAMHGTFDGLDSWLDFGSQIKLTAKEALELNLKADLVVLSACQGVIKSDGVIGLSRSFILAGTPRIIVSLWNVPDAATGKLIVNFYNFYQNMQKNSEYSQSLRQAMLTTMQDYPHPRNWAAFGLFGASSSGMISGNTTDSYR